LKEFMKIQEKYCAQMDTPCAFNFTSSRIDETEILCCYRLQIRHRQGVIRFDNRALARH
jgi:hypothetical protein